jgi:hypothetical protein
MAAFYWPVEEGNGISKWQLHSSGLKRGICPEFPASSRGSCSSSGSFGQELFSTKINEPYTVGTGTQRTLLISP